MNDAQARGGGGPGQASISINNNPQWSNMSSGDRARILTHELFHVGGYDHTAMAQAARNLGGEFQGWKAWDGPFPDREDPFFSGPDRDARLDGAYSGFFKNILDQHCK